MEKPGERQKRSLKIEKHKTHDKAGAGTWIKRNLALFMAIVTLLGALGLDVREVYAIQANRVDVNINPNGGSWNGSTAANSFNVAVNDNLGGVLILPSPPPNMNFLGWYTTRTGEMNDSTI